jgi:UDP-N-acetylmuramyl pentapeptide synthase
MNHVGDIQKLTAAIRADAEDGKIGLNTVESAETLLATVQAATLERELAEEEKEEIVEGDAENGPFVLKEGDDAIRAFLAKAGNDDLQSLPDGAPR